jgi:hypothetical protein
LNSAHAHGATESGNERAGEAAIGHGLVHAKLPR